MMWRVAFGTEPPPQPKKSNLLVNFQNMVRVSGAYVALIHFDEVANRRKQYLLYLWSTLRHLAVMDKKLVMLVQSTVGVDLLLPPGGSSTAMFDTVLLR